MKKGVLLFCITAMLLLASAPSVFAAVNTGAGLSTGCLISPGETKAIPIFLSNSDLKAHSYALTAADASGSCELYFSEGSAPADTVTVQPGASSEVDLNVSLKNSVSADAGSLSVKAVRDDGQTETIGLSVMVNKDYMITVGSMLNKIDVLSGKTAEVSFSVTNGGARELKNVQIKPELPHKWIAGQGSDSGISLKPGETGTLKVKVEIPVSQAAGNYTAKFSAVSDETESAQISIPVTVKTSSNMAWWMIGALLVIAVFTAFQFRRHGRR
jgi:uncharacterized membrane protein